MTPIIRRTALLLASSLGFGAASAADAQPISLSPEGIGQVLIYPYYTTRNGWTTLLSIVNNDSANGKAVRVRFLEGKNGASVASLNVFLAPDDIWTGAVVSGSSDTKGAQLVSNDDSCTFPSFRPLQTLIAAPPRSIEFSNQMYVADGDSPTLQSIDRTREGYIEVIEMASIPYTPTAPSALIRQIYSFATGRYQPSACDAVSDTDLPSYAAQLTQPSGGLSGAATLVNVSRGASSEYTPVTLNGFWQLLSTPSANLTASTSPLPNLSSGGNTTAQYLYDGKSYFSKFSRSIDAVSAVLMNAELLGEHAYTIDSTINTTWVVATPSKRFYTQGKATSPFVRPWNGSTGQACTEITVASWDRNSYKDFFDGCGFVCPPALPPAAICYATSVVSFGGVRVDGTDLTFASGNVMTNGHQSYIGIQNYGANVPQVGKEGGKTRLIASSSTSTLVAESGSVTSVDATTGLVSTVFGPHTLYGLPMIGVAFTQSLFRVGNPQQNFASGYRLQSTRRITSP